MKDNIRPSINKTPKEVPETIAQRSIQAGILLTTRSLLLRFVSIAGTIALSRLFLPSQFGFLAVTTGFLGMFSLVGNVGLGAAIVRNAEEPTEADYAATFFIQMVMVGLFTGVVWAFADLLTIWLLHDPSAAWPLRIASLAIIGGGLQVPPRIGLEREMSFGPMVLAEVAEVLIFYGIAIVFGLIGLSIWGISLAIALRAFVGMPFVYWSFGRVIIPRWHRESVHKLIGFGAAFQGSSIVNTLRESFTPILIAAIAGPTIAGYYGWARGIADWPISLFGGLWRVSFPGFARLPDDAGAHRNAAQKVLALVSLMTFPIAAFWTVFGESIIRLVFGSEWVPAHMLSVLMLVGLAISGPISVATSGLVLVRSGAGRILNVQIAHTIVFFTIALPLVPFYGLAGVGLGWLASNITDAILLLKYSGDSRPSLRAMAPISLSSLLAVSVGVLLMKVTSSDLIGFLVAVTGATLMGVGLLVVLGRKELSLVWQTTTVALPWLNKR